VRCAWPWGSYLTQQSKGSASTRQHQRSWVWDISRPTARATHEMALHEQTRGDPWILRIPSDRTIREGPGMASSIEQGAPKPRPQWQFKARCRRSLQGRARLQVPRAVGAITVAEVPLSGRSQRTPPSEGVPRGQATCIADLPQTEQPATSAIAWCASLLRRDSLAPPARLVVQSVESALAQVTSRAAGPQGGKLGWTKPNVDRPGVCVVFVGVMLAGCATSKATYVSASTATIVPTPISSSRDTSSRNSPTRRTRRSSPGRDGRPKEKRVIRLEVVREWLRSRRP